MIRTLEQTLALEDRLGFSLCRYPSGTFKDAPGFECEERAAPGSSYCVTHHRLCYTPAKRKLTADALDRMEKAIEDKRAEA